MKYNTVLTWKRFQHLLYNRKSCQCFAGRHKDTVVLVQLLNPELFVFIQPNKSSTIGAHLMI